VFVTRWKGSGSYDYGTVAYHASTGARLWKRRYDGGSLDVATDLGVSPDGSKVFVTGYSLGSASGLDYATVAYLLPRGHTRTRVRSTGR
jgi:outer membrane protein assembly factor BamB